MIIEFGSLKSFVVVFCGKILAVLHFDRFFGLLISVGKAVGFLENLKIKLVRKNC